MISVLIKAKVKINPNGSIEELTIFLMELNLASPMYIGPINKVDKGFSQKNRNKFFLA